MTKTKKIIVWILAGFIAFGFLFAGITKLLGTEMQIKNLESWGYPLWFRFPIGLVELVLAATILIPKYRQLTAYGIFVWTVVAVITHVQAGQAAMIGAPILFSILPWCDFISSERKDRLYKIFHCVILSCCYNDAIAISGKHKKEKMMARFKLYTPGPYT